MKVLSFLILLFAIAGCGRGFSMRVSESSQILKETSRAKQESDTVIDSAPDTTDSTDTNTAQPTPVPSATPRATPAQTPSPQPTATATPKPIPTPKPRPTQTGTHTNLEPGNHEYRSRPQLSSSDLSEGTTLKPTIYYLASNDHVQYRQCGEKDKKLLRAKDNADILPGFKAIRVCSKFYYKLQMEGSGLVRMRDGTVHLVNYAGVQLAIPRFKVVDRNQCPYGLGRSNRCLQPFISIASDPNRYKLGDVIYVPEVAMANIRLPDGDTHLGFFIITDTGAAIRGNGRFDFFTGAQTARDSDNPLARLGLQSKANSSGIKYHLIKRGSQTEKAVHDYYVGRQIVPYK